MLAALTPVANPVFDWHALAPEIMLVATIAAVLVADLIVPDRDAWQSSRIASIGVLAALDPVIDARAPTATTDSMFGGAYAVDHYALALKGFFLVATYITILISVDYIGEGDYYKGEFYVLLLTSTFGMMIMASARDLITLFVALETISIPTFILAAFRKHDRNSNEAGVKYYLIGVLSSALMLYGMSFIFGITGSTKLSEISAYVGSHGNGATAHGRDLPVAHRVRVQGQRRAVPLLGARHLRRRTHAGDRVPVGGVEGRRLRRARSTSSTSGSTGPTAAAPTPWWPVLWVLAALSMTFGNLAALRQTNIVRMLAYSSIAQGGFMLVPFAAAGIAGADGRTAVARARR